MGRGRRGGGRKRGEQKEEEGGGGQRLLRRSRGPVPTRGSAGCQATLCFWSQGTVMAWCGGTRGTFTRQRHWGHCGSWTTGWRRARPPARTHSWRLLVGRQGWVLEPVEDMWAVRAFWDSVQTVPSPALTFPGEGTRPCQLKVLRVPCSVTEAQALIRPCQVRVPGGQ